MEHGVKQTNAKPKATCKTKTSLDNSGNAAWVDWWPAK